MRDSLDVFVEQKPNEALLARLRELAIRPGLPPVPVRIVVQGAAGSGKTKLVRSCAADAAANGNLGLFACTGADMALALQVEADDSFFERLGEATVVLLDDLAPLITQDKGDLLLSLLLKERDRLGLSTVVFTREPVADMPLPQSAPLLVTFEQATLAPLDREGRVAFLDVALGEYACEGSPELLPEARRAIVKDCEGNLAGIENAARYLMTDESCRAFATLDANDVNRLLCIGN